MGAAGRGGGSELAARRLILRSQIGGGSLPRAWLDGRRAVTVSENSAGSETLSGSERFVEHVKAASCGSSARMRYGMLTRDGDLIYVSNARIELNTTASDLL